ncbi:Os09g0379300 [Oryza sativa Japonica Group]|uniref:Glycosyltransferase n=1 Tax=Oryza sativa subsp. japonica TaxID=39947 RepID=C7J6K2_ORYSJ|nr:Os09g0379300 [Oryza sativa Japonica Group]|eukprot:NP_001175809.1 Os09g0379300 [Oryza sativa Japonica Group]
MAAAAAAADSPCSRAVRHDAQLPHVAIFPFMARGHTVPPIHLAHLLRHRGLAAVTLFTTPANAPFVRRVLDDDAVAVAELPFPDHLPGVPPGVECLDGLSSFPAFVEAVSALRPRLEACLAAARPRVGLLVADALLYWAHDAAAALGVPTVAFYATSMFAHVIRDVILRDNPAAALVAGGAGSTFAVPEFPHVRLTLADIPMDAKMANAIAGSHGLIVNTFDAMEGHYIEHWDRHHVGHRAWPVGPLCLARQPCHVAGDGAGAVKPSWLQWLDEKAAAGRAVLYVALGTLIAVQEAQLRELAGGLEASGVDFLWVVRPSDADVGAGFEERVEGRGLVVREWVDQWRILRHGCVKGFLSHCGWNAVVEGVAAGVPLATWPMGVEQPLHATLAVDELRIGVRVPAAATTGHGVVSGEEIARVARELMGMDGEGENGAGGEAARNAAALAAKAREAVAEGGSSWKTLEEMLAVVCLPTDPSE